MRGISFTYARPLALPDPNRMDIACFIGLVRQRQQPVIQQELVEWWRRFGWLERVTGETDPVRIENVLEAGAITLSDVPVPVDSLDEFMALYDGSARVVTSGVTCDGYLAAAVRSFFAQGGRSCYVVSMGEPLPLTASPAERISQLGRLLFADDPLWPAAAKVAGLKDVWLPQFATSGESHLQWHGIEHLLGLPEVSLVSLPDIPDLLQAGPQQHAPSSPCPAKEIFSDCTPAASVQPESIVRFWAAPRCDADGYLVWGRIIGRLVDFIRTAAREVQLLVSLPLPHEDFELGVASFLENELLACSDNSGCASAFLQLAYPWLVNPAADRLPGAAEPPEGVLAGILAASSMAKGAYSSAAGTLVRQAYAVVPTGFASACNREQEESSTGTTGGQEIGVLCDRISIFDSVPRGIQLQTDVTTSCDRNYRPAAVNRLVATVVRAARNQGTSALFEGNSPATWRTVTRSLESILVALHEDGGLRGGTPAEAFEVTCDMRTMTQNDIDNGRLVAQVIVQPSVPVERITVALTLADGGPMAMRGGE